LGFYQEWSRLWELYPSENTLRHVRVSGVAILGCRFLLWTIALNAIVLNCLIMLVLPVEAMLAERLPKSKARKRRLARGFVHILAKAESIIASLKNSHRED
jgi:hypothetical protein